MKPRLRQTVLGLVLGILAGAAVIFVALPQPLSPPAPAGPVAAADPLFLPIEGRGPGASEAGQQRLRSLFRVPPGASELISIGDELQTNKVPMNLASFETQDSWEQVLTFYAMEFQRQQWSMYGVEQLKDITPYPAISATLLDEQLQLSVVAMPHSDEPGTTVILAVADMGRLRENLAAPAAGDLPVYPGTQPLAIRSVDEGLRALTVSFETSDAPGKIASFYREQLAALGYRSEGGLVFVSPERRWTLALLAEGARTSVTAQAQEVAQ